MLYSLPSVLVLILVYLRLRAALQMDALLIRERATAETFRLLYEASQLEPPSRLIAGAREAANGEESTEPEKDARGVYVPMLM